MHINIPPLSFLPLSLSSKVPDISYSFILAFGYFSRFYSTSKSKLSQNVMILLFFTIGLGDYFLKYSDILCLAVPSPTLYNLSSN